MLWNLFSLIRVCLYMYLNKTICMIHFRGSSSGLVACSLPGQKELKPRVPLDLVASSLILTIDAAPNWVCTHNLALLTEEKV